jgi:hypothetical protein
MAVPSTRNEFKEYCLRKLGKPVIEINVDDDQVEDRIDESLRYYWDYHFDGSERIYYKYRIVGNEGTSSINTITISNGGISYTNGDIVSFSDTGRPGNAEANVITNSVGTITGFNYTSYGYDYSTNVTATVTSNTGSGASITPVLGDGSFILPENIIGAVRVFPIGDPLVGTQDMFNIRYQIALNDLYTLTSVSMVPYYMVMQHLGLIQEMLVGQQPIRYNRHRNKLYVDMDWKKMLKQEYLLIEAYEIVNPDVYSDAWGDRWLQEYCTAKIKYQWGSNLTKFTGLQMPGGVQYNGDRILSDAEKRIDDLEKEMISSYSLPVMDMIN